MDAAQLSGLRPPLRLCNWPDLIGAAQDRRPTIFNRVQVTPKFALIDLLLPPFVTDVAALCDTGVATFRYLI
jgi:hypothetical protein